MNILSIGNFTTGWDGSICDEENIANSLEELGHKVTRMQRESAASFNRADKSEYDFILIAQWNGYPIGILAELKYLYKCPTVYWAFDYQWDNHEDWHLQLVRDCDVFLTKEIAHMDKYRKNAISTKVHWLPQDFAPNFLAGIEIDVDEQDIDVLFTGSYLPWAEDRNRMIRAVDKAFNLEVHSVTQEQWTNAGIKNSQGPVMDLELANLIPRAKINLSIDHTNSAGYWSDRNSQVMALGGFVLFYYVPFSEQVFHDGVTYFYNELDMIKKIEHYLESRTRRVNTMVEAQKYYTTAQSRTKDMLAIVRSYL